MDKFEATQKVKALAEKNGTKSVCEELDITVITLYKRFYDHKWSKPQMKVIESL